MADFGVINELFAMHGSAQATGSNTPMPLVDPGAVWLVTEGHIDIVALAISRESGSADLQRTHLLRIPAGQVLFGFHAHPEGHNVLIMGYGSADAKVSRLPVERLASAAADPPVAHEVAAAVDRWITAICQLCAGDLTPSGTLNVRAGATCTLEAGQSAQPQSGVLWLKPLQGGARFLSHDGPCTIRGDILFPVGKDAWLTADDDRCTFASLDSGTLVLDESYWRGLDAFHDTVEAVIDIQRQRDRQATRQRLVAKSAADRQTIEAAFGDLESILNRRRTAMLGAGAETGLLAACRLVGERAGIEIRESGRASRSDGVSNPLEEIARSSRSALRRVELRGAWHRQDNGPLLAFKAQGDGPVALLPARPTRYEMHDVTAGTVRPVTAAVAAEVRPSAFMFYRTLPDQALGGVDLARFALRGLRRDLLTVALMGAAAGLLMLATPVAIGHVFDVVIPGVERLQLAQITMGLAVAAFAVGAFQVTRNVALIRLKHRSGDGLQAAVWERLINLPSRFFGDYTAGDLGLRAMGIDSIMEQLSTSAITTIVSSIFSVFAVALLFYYSPMAAAVAVGMVLVVLAAVVASGLAQVSYRRSIEESQGRMAGMLLQFMNGISKIRIAAAEGRAFARWADRFAQQTRLEVATRVISNNLSVFLSAVPLLSSIVLFLLVARPSDGGPAGVMTTGVFLGFIAAFATLLNGMIQLGTTAVGLLNVVPIYDRLKPILESAPEIDASKTDPGALRGRIEVSNVSFRYKADGPLVLEDVSFDAHPGEFIALVGASGSGKSTLLRILLGFEQPESGSVAYDGFDLSGIDLWRLRRQLGVVLQNGDLLPGDIFTNIVGSAVDLTLDDAWEAARLAGLDRDVEQMPMGMHTVITEGASTLSGGQRQRLMIARALVTKPRIVFFDEATSALDNPTQAVVTESLDRLRATRIVIAHRLSTIINADRIFVLDGGRVVQRGSYEELVKQPGLFHELVKRQIA